MIEVRIKEREHYITALEKAGESTKWLAENAPYVDTIIAEWLAVQARFPE